MTQIETLIQQLTHAMSGNLDRAIVERFAADYAAHCRMANRRLEQCLAVVQHGNPSAAVQLAEMPPSLLDLVAALSFDRSSQWRQFCQTRQLPEAEPVNERALSRLNEVYSKAIPPIHPLYRDYRQAMADRNEMRGLKAIRALAEQEPQDAGAQAELKRLERKLQTDIQAIEKKTKDDLHFQTLLAELRTAANRDDLDGSDDELREQHNTLTHWWQLLQETHRPLPPDATNSLARRQKMLADTLSRRRSQRIAVAVFATGMITILLVIAWYWPVLRGFTNPKVKVNPSPIPKSRLITPPLPAPTPIPTPTPTPVPPPPAPDTNLTESVDMMTKTNTVAEPPLP